MRGLSFAAPHFRGPFISGALRQNPASTSPMPIPPELLAAYRAALYVVFGDPEVVLRVGAHDAAVDRWLERSGARGGAYLTAANPGSVIRSTQENLHAAAALQLALHQRGFRALSGESRDPKGIWPNEPSLFALDLPRDEARELGRRHGQNAFVYVRLGEAPELVVA